MRVALNGAYARASRAAGLTVQQAEVLCAAMEPRTMTELAADLRCERSNVSHHFERAAARGLLRRARSDDARETIVELTPEGQRLARRFLGILEDETAELRRTWPGPRERDAARLLDEISDALDSGAQDVALARQHDRMRRRSATTAARGAQR